VSHTQPGCQQPDCAQRGDPGPLAVSRRYRGVYVEPNGVVYLTDYNAGFYVLQFGG
jgi:hypothetical protein